MSRGAGACPARPLHRQLPKILLSLWSSDLGTAQRVEEAPPAGVGTKQRLHACSSH